MVRLAAADLPEHLQPQVSGHTDNPAYMSDLADRLLKLAANPFTGPESAALMAEAANALRALRPEAALREWKHGDPERRKDNWTLLVSEYWPKFDFEYRDRQGKTWRFFGLVHAEDDLYYGMMDKNGKVQLASCVGSLDGEHGWYEQVPNGGRCKHCNCVYPVSGPTKCDRYRCPQGDDPLPEPQNGSA